MQKNKALYFLRQAVWPKVLLLALFALLICPALAHAQNAEENAPKRLESLSGSTSETLDTFRLRGVKFETSCLIRGSQFEPLFNRYMNKKIHSATVLKLMRQMRSALAKQGFRSIQTQYTPSDTEDGVVTIKIKAHIPPAMADTAQEECLDEPIFLEETTKALRKVIDIEIGGATLINIRPFLEEAQHMVGKPYNALAVIGLMRDIRNRYREENHRLPFISIDKQLSAEGVIQLTIVEKGGKGGAPVYLSLEDIAPPEETAPAPEPTISSDIPLKEQPEEQPSK